MTDEMRKRGYLVPVRWRSEDHKAIVNDVATATLKFFREGSVCNGFFVKTARTVMLFADYASDDHLSASFRLSKVTREADFDAQWYVAECEKPGGWCKVRFRGKGDRVRVCKMGKFKQKPNRN